MGLTANGFERKTLLEILDSLKARAKSEFGPDFNTADDALFTQLAGVFTIELDEAWQALEGAYSAYTYTGAEGVYLDDMFSRHNITRLAAIKSTGTAFVESSNATVLPQTIASSTASISTSGTTYSLSSDKIIDIDTTSAYKILSADISLGTTYTFRCDDDSGIIQTAVILATVKATFVADVKSFLDATNTAVAAKTFIFTALGEEAIYFGFDGNKTLDPLASEIEFQVSPAIGNRYTSVSLVADVAGYNPLPSRGVKDLTPKFTGFVSVANVVAFNSGAGVETDAAFRARFNQLIDASAFGSDRASIESAILGIDNVTAVRIYENPSPIDITEAKAYTYNTVVFGGDPIEITDVLFATGPINVLTDGTTSVDKTTSSGDIIPFKYSPATAVPLLMRVTYSTLVGTDFTAFEEQSVFDAVAELSLNFGIGATVYNIQLNSTVISSLSYGRLISLTVETDLKSAPTGYTTADFPTAFDEYPQISEIDISFVRV